jgi:hypothetical protein
MWCTSYADAATTTGHLIALKTLAGRNQDLTDLGSLIPAASTEDLDVARP